MTNLIETPLRHTPERQVPGGDSSLVTGYQRACHAVRNNPLKGYCLTDPPHEYIEESLYDFEGLAVIGNDVRLSDMGAFGFHDG